MFERHQYLLWGYWYLYFGLLVMSVLGFKARVYPSLAWFVAFIQYILKIHLWCDSCWPPDGQHGSRAFLIHVLAHVYTRGAAWKHISFPEILWLHQLWISVVISKAPWPSLLYSTRTTMDFFDCEQKPARRNRYSVIQRNYQWAS